MANPLSELRARRIRSGVTALLLGIGSLLGQVFFAASPNGFALSGRYLIGLALSGVLTGVGLVLLATADRVK